MRVVGIPLIIVALLLLVKARILGGLGWKRGGKSDGTNRVWVVGN